MFVWVHTACAESANRTGFMHLPDSDADAILGTHAQNPMIGANHLLRIGSAANAPEVKPVTKRKASKSKSKAKTEPKPEAEIVDEVLDGICSED